MRQVVSVKFKYHFNLTFAAHHATFNRSGEKDLVEKLDGIVPIGQEFHKKLVRPY